MTAIIQDIASIFFVLALGYFSGKRNSFSQVQAAGFNHLVLNYALPATLFVSIANSTREELFSDTRSLLVSTVVLVGWYVISFLVAMFGFRHNKQESGIAGLSAAAPTVGFLGMAVLSPLFGGQAALSVAIVALVVNVLQVPLAVFFVAPGGTNPVSSLINALKQPVVLAPLIAVIIVALGLRFPPLADPPLELIGHATSGVAVFAAGLVLSAHKFHLNLEVIWNTIVKLVFVPACMLGGAMWLGISGIKLEELVLLATLPPAFTGIVLAGRYQTYVGLASSTLIVTSFMFAIAAPAWIALVRYLAAN
ncbi:AEC family transporter [Hyphomicrobium sulfonivorans]|uniref:AEC family transporter n=1 Tax=Hyphomicrobium sulfonivorans TaxID=121290 RepID=UPI0015700C4D|nr:AEC family transporter [Hyphomicrobium sulfonivorans]MBI1648934.1 AEC family transporter [Hyphomicrobium sulfonivorans]NSL70531.1 hypothetical protein [Hyphomicrobium sulfonivorans]